MKIRQQGVGHGKCSRLDHEDVSLKDALLSKPQCGVSLPLDLFLPKPSLSTTSSAHCILGLLACSGGAVARKRRTGVEVIVWVAVGVVELGALVGRKVCAADDA